MSETFDPKSYGITLFPELPADFAPGSASQDALEKYGYPPRPDPSVAPPLYRAWMNRFSRKGNRITPTFKVLEDWRPAPWTIELWAGGIATQEGAGLSAITADWTVPFPRVPLGAPKSNVYQSLIWVGLSQPAPLLRAGTAQNFDPTQPSPAPDVWAWFQWEPNPAVKISLPLQPGDTVSVVIGGAGAIQFQNVSTGDSAVISVSPPQGSPLFSSAQWIVSLPPTPEFVPVYLADVGEIIVHKAYAFYDGFSTLTLDDAQSINYVTDPIGSSLDVSIPPPPQRGSNWDMQVAFVPAP